MSIQVAGATSPFKVVRATADDGPITADTTLSDDAHLTFSVNANEVWFFQVFESYTAANVSMDVKVGWSVPDGTTMRWGTMGISDTVSSGGFGPRGTAIAPTAALTATDTTPFGSGALTLNAAYAGWVFVGATAGTVAKQWAQNTSDAGALTRLSNSFLLLTRLA